MTTTPSADNYSLGRGVLYFDKKDPDTGLYTGERDLGNTPAFSVTLALEKLDHFSSRSGLKAKDKTVVVQVTPTFTFTLDEVNSENMAMLFMASVATTTQTAILDTVQSSSVVVSGSILYQDRWYNTNSTQIGCMSVPISGLSGGTPAAGDNFYVTASGTKDHKVVSYTSLTLTAGVILCVNTDATNEALVTADLITNGTWTANADFTGLPGVIAAFSATNVLVYNTLIPATVYTLTTDYLVDSETGRIKIVNGGTIADATGITIRFHRQADSYATLASFVETDFEGVLHFVSDNPVGPNYDLKIWRGNLTPAGEAPFIGDTWMTLQFNGEILKDETNHASNPYMQLKIFV
jgi:hypothetical protein